LHPGDLVTIDDRVDPGGYAPPVLPESLRVTGTGPAKVTIYTLTRKDGFREFTLALGSQARALAGSLVWGSGFFRRHRAGIGEGHHPQATLAVFVDEKGSISQIS